MLKIQLFKVTTENGCIFVGQQILDAEDPGAVPRNNPSLLRFHENHSCNIDKSKYEVLKEYRYCLTNKTIAMRDENALRKELVGPEKKVDVAFAKIAKAAEKVKEEKAAEVMTEAQENGEQVEEAKPAKKRGRKKAAATNGEEAPLDKGSHFYKAAIEKARAIVARLVENNLPINKKNVNTYGETSGGFIRPGKVYALEAIRDACAEAGVAWEGDENG